MILKSSKIILPTNEKTAVIKNASASERIATDRVVALSSPAVSPRNTGTLAIGFMMAKKPMKIVAAKVQMSDMKVLAPLVVLAPADNACSK